MVISSAAYLVCQIHIDAIRPSHYGGNEWANLRQHIYKDERCPAMIALDYAVFATRGSKT